MESINPVPTPPIPPINTSPTTTNIGQVMSDTLTPAQHWKTFRSYTKAIRGKQQIVFEDKQAKADEHSKRGERQWIRSDEEHSVFFDFRDIGHQPQEFMVTLKDQFPAAVGHIPAPKKYNGVIIAFEDAATCTRVCTLGVSFNHKTIIGTPTLSAENEVYKVNLEQLPLLHKSRLTPLLQNRLAVFGKVLHIGLFFDPLTTLFYGKGYAIIDTSAESSLPYEPLTHLISLLGRRNILATWHGMEKHCFYCHQPNHIVAECPDILKMGKKPRACYGCGSTDHFIHICPKVNNGEAGDKRLRTDNGSDIRKASDLSAASAPVSSITTAENINSGNHTTDNNSSGTHGNDNKNERSNVINSNSNKKEKSIVISSNGIEKDSSFVIDHNEKRKEMGLVINNNDKDQKKEKEQHTVINNHQKQKKKTDDSHSALDSDSTDLENNDEIDAPTDSEDDTIMDFASTPQSSSVRPSLITRRPRRIGGIKPKEQKVSKKRQDKQKQVNLGSSRPVVQHPLNNTSQPTPNKEIISLSTGNDDSCQ
ncbi:hypothetical protein INT45_004877 [Circinella minor]|uniref:CCHC-type domain-containing protein n=1 Tax=Circinella minor TaxID=1195481 RepID=A0A8H7RSK6_9FUNG|nr:hypothetical protein INT45_004877 [Circinella minor]